MKPVRRTPSLLQLRQLALTTCLLTITGVTLAQDQDSQTREIIEGIQNGERVEVQLPDPEKQLPLDDLRKFTEVFSRIKDAYVEEVSDRKLLESAIKGMLSDLDPHSTYLAPKDYEELEESTSGEFGGLGIEVGMENGFIKVIAPIDDTPAQQAGVQAGDVIIKLGDKPVKGMLTGPVTILNWSFVRDDQPRRDSCRQLALAIREEVQDLERAGVNIIQIDDAALREGLPLRRSDWHDYLDWAINSFRIAANGVSEQTQIHTHMCYSEFNDIIEGIARMDADVITIETSRSDMALLDAFKHFEYPNDIGPGVYDIHSPNLPDQNHIVDLVTLAAERIPAERLWVNPDCGLKTRKWEEVTPALETMVAAAKRLRATAAAQ